MKQVELSTDLMKCKNCKHYKGGVCSVDPDKTKTQPEDECFIGLYEPMDYKSMMREAYDEIDYNIEYYMDIKPEIKNLITLWIMGTHFHHNFQSYPYLFLNAMKGSGKTRLLKLISVMAKEGQLTSSLTESVMFRTTGTLCLDEFESVASKDNSALRELLNASYKKGNKVMRMRKKKLADGETQEVESFELYRPLAMANIFGLTNVLSDRCISVVLQKSPTLAKINLIEDFEGISQGGNIKNLLLKVSKCSLCSVGQKNNKNQEWNNFIKNKYTLNTLTTTTTLTTLTTPTTTTSDDFNLLLKQGTIITKDNTKLFNLIDETGIEGRYLELFFPLFMIAEEVSEDSLKEIIKYAKDFVYQKRIDEAYESKDVMVIIAVSKERPNEFIDIKSFTEIYKLTYGDSADWVTTIWMGRALKRLDLVKDKRRVGKGMQVILDIDKAQRQARIFKPKEDEQQKKNTDN